MSLFSNIASIVRGSGANTLPAEIRAFDVLIGTEVPNSGVQFQYFPEKIQDTKSVNYSSKEIPGGSHPVYQFISGGARQISFDAIFSNDAKPETVTDPFQRPTVEAGGRKDVVDIVKTVAKLRSYLYPRYQGNVSKPPFLCVVYLPRSGIESADTDGVVKDSFVGVMQRCDVTYESFHRDGTPRLVTVSLSFDEVLQTSKKWKFVGADRIGGGN